MMDKKVKRLLWSSFVSLAIICVISFVWLTIFMSKRTERTIAEISEIYMEEMNGQLQQKFISIVQLRLEQLEGIIKSIPAEDSYNEEMINNMITNTKVRSFSYLGFYTEEGELEEIYGEDLEFVSDKDAIKESLEENGNIVEQGIGRQGEKILILGKSANYRMKDGSKSAALVVGVTMDYLNKALFLENQEKRVNTHIIDGNGDFIIRTGQAYKNNYFERLREILDKDVEEHIRCLQEAMAIGETYSTQVLVEGETRYMYCTPISENSTWYLITVMEAKVLDASISKLDVSRIESMIFSSAVIIVTMVVIFILYFRLSQQQMKRLDETKQEAIHASRAKSDFLSSMSHDIRTPMNAIIGMTEIAMKNIDDNTRVKDCLEKVRLSSKHLLGLINDVLDMSKIESGKMTLNMDQISLRETMDDMVNIIQPQVKERNQYFDIFIRDIQAEEVYCDGIRLNQLILNLLSNALKFTPEEGRIDIRVYQENSPLGDSYVRTHFWVEDNGIGMSEEFRRKIFDSFERENREKVHRITGTGLGMAIVKAIVDLMNGTIELYSELDKGSKFHITLDMEKVDKQGEVKLPEWNILVVDDNEQLCTSAVANLEELGVHAEWTQDGKEAIKMIEEHHQKGDDYRFVLIDWKMPQMDGLQTIRELRNRVGKEIPVFLISAYDWSDIEEEVQSVEIEGFISKPLFKSTLYSRLSQYVEGADSTAEQTEGQVAIDFTGKRILLAEDIDINWEIANEILTSFGFEVTRAVNGKECIELFEKSEMGYYDTILMDIRMPIMNGYDATKGIRALERSDSELPIIAMTADAFDDDVQYCLNCGMNGHIAKPIDIKELVRLLQKFLV